PPKPRINSKYFHAHNYTFSICISKLNPMDSAGELSPIFQPKSRTQEIKNVPSEYAWVRNQFLDLIKKPESELLAFYGHSENSNYFRVFHGTLDSKLESIQKEGLKAFVEFDQNPPKIYVTLSPTLALWHATTNGPHDTLRAEGKMLEKPQGNPTLLLIDI